MPRVVGEYAVLFVIFRVVLRRPVLASRRLFSFYVACAEHRWSVVAALPIYITIAGSATWLFSRTGLVGAGAYLATGGAKRSILKVVQQRVTT